MNQRAIIYIILAVIGIPVLITIGIWSATDPMYAGVSAMIIIGLWVITQLGSKAWLLLSFFGAFGGALVALPGNFAPRDLAVGMVVLILLPLWVVQRFPTRIQFGSLEVSFLVIVLFLGQAYMRNPTGLSIFGSENIGGKAYFEVGVSVVAFLVLSILVVDLKSIKQMVYTVFAGKMCAALYDTALGVFPILGVYGASIYRSGGSTDAIMTHLGLGADPDLGTGRLTYLKNFFRPITVLVFAYLSPMQLLNPRNVGYLLLMIFAGVTVLLSGYRSGIAAMGMFAIAACFLHGKPIQLMFMGLLGGPIVAVVLLLQGSLVELPLSAQRAMSFLPADWDSRAADEANNSTDWRFEMWEEALKSDRYIRNKWLGDGFGFTAREKAYHESLTMGGAGGGKDLQEFYLMTGTFHSGPIETIKRVGYLGLCCLLIAMGVVFRVAVKLVGRTRGTPYFPYAIFFALPLVIHPFFFILVFGSFKGSLTILFFGGGGLRMLRNSFDQWIRARESESAGAAQKGKLPSGRMRQVGAN